MLLTGNFLQDLSLEHAARGLLASKRLVRAPLGRRARCRLLHHQVHLLEGQALGLGDEEVRVHKGACAQREPHEKDGRHQGVDHVRRNNGNDAVPQPVGRRRECDAARPDRQREDLANHDPGAGPPGGGEREDEDGDEGDLRLDGGRVVRGRATGDRGVRMGVIKPDGDAHGADDELADQHGERTPE